MAKKYTPRKCKVPSCTNTSENMSISLFSFPADPVRKKLWYDILNIPYTNIKSYAYICQNHFKSEEFVGTRKLRLNKDAKPFNGSILYAKQCVVRGCSFNTIHKLFPVPPDPDMRKRWCEAVGVDLRKFYVCENHFTNDSFVFCNIFKIMKLKPTAVPNKCMPPFGKYEDNVPANVPSPSTKPKERTRPICRPRPIKMLPKVNSNIPTFLNSSNLNPFVRLRRLKIIPKSLGQGSATNQNLSESDKNCRNLRNLGIKRKYPQETIGASVQYKTPNLRRPEFSINNVRSLAESALLPSAGVRQTPFYIPITSTPQQLPILKFPLIHPLTYINAQSSSSIETTCNTANAFKNTNKNHRSESAATHDSTADTDINSECFAERHATTCIVCNQDVYVELSQVSNKEFENLKMFLCEILNVEFEMVNYADDNLPFCEKCFGAVDDLRDIYMEINMLQHKLEIKRLAVIEKIVTAYVHKNSESENLFRGVFSNYNCESAKVAILNRWKGAMAQQAVLIKQRRTENKHTQCVAVAETHKDDLAEIGSDLHFPDCSPASVDDYNSDADNTEPLDKNTGSTEIGVSGISNGGSTFDKEGDVICEAEAESLGEENNTTVLAVEQEKTKKKKRKKGNSKDEASVKKRVKRVKKSAACPVCSKVQCSRDALTLHMRIHTGERPFQCNICGQCFRQKPHLAAHQQTMHENSEREPNMYELRRLYKCGMCTSKPCGKGHFLRHQKRLHYSKGDVVDKQEFWFNFCDARECMCAFLDQQSLRDHFLQVHNAECPISECDSCPRIFSMVESLREHKKSHLVPDETHQVFGCDFCSKTFASELELIQHRGTHRLIFDVSLFKHLCELCGEGFRTVIAFKLHINMTHGDKRKSDDSDLRKEHRKKCATAEKKDICTICGASLFSSGIKAHMYRHTHPEGIPCHLCAHRATNPKALERHLINIHQQPPTTNSSLLACQYCNQKIPARAKNDFQMQKHLINFHRDEHLQGRKHCKHCYRIFDTKEEVDAHFKEKHSHLICPVYSCNKFFNTKKAWDHHQNVHKNLRPFKCSYCDMSFNHDSTRDYHVNVKHTYHRSYLCKLCPDNIGFYDKRMLIRHADGEHPGCPHEEIFLFNYPKKKNAPRMPPVSK